MVLGESRLKSSSWKWHRDSLKMDDVPLQSPSTEIPRIRERIETVADFLLQILLADNLERHGETLGLGKALFC